jgi:hypothetical protein
MDGEAIETGRPRNLMSARQTPTERMARIRKTDTRPEWLMGRAVHTASATGFVCTGATYRAAPTWSCRTFPGELRRGHLPGHLRHREGSLQHA